jgi:CHAT domain-containing protein/tetratricopeptide (TPR) repeat protein
MMKSEVTEKILEHIDSVELDKLLEEIVPSLAPDAQDELAKGLKDKADQLMRTNIQRCLEAAGSLKKLSDLNGNPMHRALWLLAMANANTVVLGQYRLAVEYYDEAAAIYQAQGDLGLRAQAQIGRVWALAALGEYDRALADGEWAQGVLREYGEWLHLARLQTNLASIHARLSQYPQALALYDQAKDAYQQLGMQGEPNWLRLEVNRANVLRYLGRFSESMQASQTAIEKYQGLGQTVAAARAQQSLAITHYVLGRYNESLALLDEVREVLWGDGRQRHAVLAELFISDCLLQLRRFSEVIEKCRQVRALFGELGTRFEVGQAILNEARAYTGLERYEEAAASLREARSIFQEEGNRAAQAETDLQAALVQFIRGDLRASLDLSVNCAVVFRQEQLPVWEAQAYLAAARAALALGQFESASDFVHRALRTGEEHNMPALTYPCHYLIGQLAVQQSQPEQGLVEIDRAIQELEHLCGRLMIEFRATFIEDKGRLYEDAVSLCLDLDQPLKGLEYVERAKSRALLDLLSHRLDLSITARSEKDQPIVEELLHLRRERDQLYRHLDGEGFGQRGDTDPFEGERVLSEHKVLDLEKRITELWHRLLVRNAGYARDAALWQIRSEPVQPYLEPDTLLLVYYIMHGRLVVFLVGRGVVSALPLSIDLSQVQHLLQLLWLNLRSVPRSELERLPHLEANARGILSRLYQGLLAPVLENEELGFGDTRRLVIVPHGPLHYLPFQALYNGRDYLLEGYEISYLPGANFLRYCADSSSGWEGQDYSVAAIGYSSQGKLPYTVEEAAAVAGIWGAQAVLEDQATLERFRQLAVSHQVLHLATHGDFRPDNPLFSGLSLADGWLTTLDVFNMRLKASLVTLSGCQTGRSVVGGGDELLGLMRSFLSAGATSLVATLWAVEDRSSARLMEAFYRGLASGATKGAALRGAQLELRRGVGENAGFSHPYFWAPFFLVGDAGRL